jgi:hypothetical protein
MQKRAMLKITGNFQVAGIAPAVRRQGGSSA